MKLSVISRSLIIIALVELVLSTTFASSQISTGEPFSVANNSVNRAFASIYVAEQNGGDATSLVERLNVAIFLILRANAENATSPSAATTDLSDATAIAQMVSSNSASVSSSGSTARQLRLYESLGTIFATLGVATLTYLMGDRVYRRLWLFVYKKHLVKKTDE